MEKSRLSGVISASSLPAGFKKCLLDMLAREAPFSLREPLKKDPAAFITVSGRLLAGGSAALGCTEEEALFATGFVPSNRAPHRLEAALAELLAAAFLAGEGFKGLKLIAPDRGRTADIAAVKNGLSCAFEVRCLKAGGGPLEAGLLRGKYDRKFPQARNAVKKHGFDRAALVFVREPCSFTGFVKDPGLAELAKEVYLEKTSPRAAHVCLLDRGRAGFYPPWN